MSSNGGTFSTPRPVPSTRHGAIAGTVVLVVALPIFFLLDWSLAGWGIAAGLWVAYQVTDLLFARMPLGMDNLGSAGVVAVGRTFRTVILTGILIAVAVADASLGLHAALVYATAYTVEFGLSMAKYFGGEAK